VLADNSRTKRPRNTKIDRKVVHPTGNNAHQFQGQRQRSRSLGRHNVEIGSASYLPNGKAYELQTWCTDGGRRRIAVMDHHQQGQRLRSRCHVVRLTGPVLAHNSRTKRLRNIKIGKQVTDTTSNNAHQFQGQKPKVKLDYC